MEWDKNTKIIVAVIVVIILIAAGAGIALAMNNNDNGKTEITYQGNGGTTSDGKSSVTLNNDKVLDGSTIFSNGANTFTGWKEGDKTWNVGDIISGKHTLTAQWSSNPGLMYVTGWSISAKLPANLYVDGLNGQVKLGAGVEGIKLPGNGSTTIYMDKSQTGWKWDEANQGFVKDGKILAITAQNVKSFEPVKDSAYPLYNITYDPADYGKSSTWVKIDVEFYTMEM